MGPDYTNGIGPPHEAADLPRCHSRHRTVVFLVEMWDQRSRSATASHTRAARAAFDPIGRAAEEPSAPSSQPSLSSTSNARPAPTALTTSRSHPLRSSL